MLNVDDKGHSNESRLSMSAQVTSGSSPVQVTLRKNGSFAMLTTLCKIRKCGGEYRFCLGWFRTSFSGWDSLVIKVKYDLQCVSTSTKAVFAVFA